MPSKKARGGAPEDVSVPSAAAGLPVLEDASLTVDLSYVVADEPVVKRRKGLGVRVIGGRIYDPVNGKTCHQCRQKTTDHMAQCKSIWGAKPCTQNFCAKCLLNRYGESTEEVVQVDNWKCPRCRGDCNCSICLKKQGRTPTGILSHTAKATGFSSVADLLKKCPDLKSDNLASSALKSLKKETVKVETSEINGESYGEGRKVKDADQNLSKSESSRKRKKKNSIVTVDGKKEPDSRNDGTESVASDKKKVKKARRLANDIDLNVIPKKEVTNEVNVDETIILKATKDKKSVNDSTSQSINTSIQDVKRKKNNKVKDVYSGSSATLVNDSTAQSNNTSIQGGNVKGKKNNKGKEVYSGSSVTMIVTTEPGTGHNKLKVPSKKQLKDKEECFNGDLKEKESKMNSETDVKEPKKRKRVNGLKFAFAEETIVLPNGTPLVTVGGMDFPAEAIGAALQLIEFCSAFRSILELKKGDAEAMLRELTKGRLVRKGANSLLVQFQAKLLALIVHGTLEITDVVSLSSTDKNSWLNILKNHLAERSTAFMGLATNAKASSDNLKEDTDTEASIGDEVAEASKPQNTVFAMSETLKNNLLAIWNGIEGGADGYENLAMQHKLQLLIILCDDCLETECLRDFIESVHREYCEAQKENRDEVVAAKKEERNAKQKIKDAEVAKYLAAANITGPLAPKQKEELLSTVEAETEKAVAAASLLKEAVSRLNKGRNNAVRTDTIAWAPDGRAFYKLNGVNNLKSIVLQDIGGFDMAEQDRWAIYSEEEENVLSKHIEQRVRLSRRKILAEVANEASPTKREEEKENLMPVYPQVS